MKAKKHPPCKDRRDIGQVISPIEKLMAAREASSSCVGVEALLEIDARRIRAVKPRARRWLVRRRWHRDRSLPA